MRKINYRNVMTVLLVGGVIVTSIPSKSILASDENSYISATRYTENKLSSGDKFEIELDFVPTTAITNIQSVEVNGEAVDTKDYKYELYSPSTGEIKEGSIGIGELTTIGITNLVYTGKGDTVEVVIKHTGGVLRETVTLDTITTDDVKGALILDSSVPSNMSITMEAGTSKEFSLSVKNTSQETIKNSTVKLNLEKTTVGLSIKDGQYSQITSLQPGKTQIIKFTVEVSEKVKAGTYEVQVEINGVKQNILLEIENNDKSAVIEMNYPSTTVFNAGSANKLDLTLANKGNEGAYNVKLYLQSKEGVGLVGTSSVILVGDLEANSSKNTPINIQLDDSKEGQLVSVPFKLTYTTKSGEQVEESQEIYLNVKGESSQEAEVSINTVKVSKASVGEGGTFNVSFNVSADSLAENVKVSIKMPEGVLATSQNTFMIDKLEKGKAKAINIACMVTDKASEGYQPIELIAEYDYKDETQKIYQYTGINSLVTEDEEEEEEEGLAIEPKVIVEGYNITPEILRAGEEATLEIKLTNTHATESVKNLTATYTTVGDEQIIVPVDTGNTLYTQTILPGQTVSQVLKFKVSSNAEVKNYQINVDLNYETDDIQKIEGAQTMIVSVSDKGAIQIGALEGASISKGKSVPLTIPLYNRGNADIRNVMVYLEGEGFEVKDNELYISSFTQGGTEYYLPTITANSDNVSISLIIECENSEGIIEKIEYPLDLSSNASESNMGAGKGEGMTPGRKDAMGEGGANMTPEERTSMMQKMKNGESSKDSAGIPVWSMCIMGAIFAGGSILTYRLFRKRKVLKGQDEYENL